MGQLKSLSSWLGLLMIVLGCIAYYLGQKKAVNPLIGFRIPPTYRDPEVWKAVNIRSGILLVLPGIFMTMVGLGFPNIILSTFLLILLLPLAMMIIYGTWYAYKLEKINE